MPAVNNLKIKVKTDSGVVIEIEVIPDTDGTVSYDPDEAQKSVESEYQLKESCTYEYWISSPDFQLEQIPGIVKNFKNKASGGRITPGNYTGTLKIPVIKISDGIETAFINLEVCSVKTEYRSEYRYMLEEITEKCTDLIMQYSSPSAHYFEPTYDKDPRTLYQRFAFIRSIILSEEFRSAVHRIISSPVVRWEDEYESADIRNTKRFKSYEIKQIAAFSKRIKTPAAHYLFTKIKSLPEKISTVAKKDCIDTPENRFIKHALNSFLFFVSFVRSKMDIDTREKKEAAVCENILEDFLSHSVFKEISRPVHLNLNSPVLQRKEGYREVYKTWLMFDLASKLVWYGGEDVYSAGKRDVAALYEYWLFFKLLEMMEDIFQIEPKKAEELIEETGNGLGLKLKSGKQTALDGLYFTAGRKLKVRFSYNRQFTGDSKYPKSGSWSVTMKPDYTLSIWPAEFEESQAEEQEIILHIHFDAKYKVDSYKELLGNNEKKSSEEKDDAEDIENIVNLDLEDRRAVYKRVDLYKMHAYKDAIRRTAGAYVLYPGNEETVKKGFHEIIPGLGAFSVRPSGNDNGIVQLKNFILDVFNNFMTQASNHERLSYHKYDIYQKTDNFKLKDAVPEKYNEKREKPPAEIYVLVGYVQIRKEQKKWVERNKYYNIRFDDPVSPQLTGAEYLLLYDEKCFDNENCITDNLYRIKDYPEIWTKEKLKLKGYPDPGKEEYFVFQIEPVTDVHLTGKQWDISKLDKYKSNKKYKPFPVTLAELMNVLIN